MILPDRMFSAAWIRDVRLRRLAAQVQLLLIFLRSLCDRNGRFEFSPALIHMALYKSAECGNVSVRDVEAWLETLRSGGFIKAYIGSDGRRVGEVASEYWRQRLNFGKAEFEPEPGQPELALVAAPPLFFEPKRSEAKRRDTSESGPARAGEDEIFLALAKAEGAQVDQLTKRARRVLLMSANEIRHVCPAASAQEVERRVAVYRRRFPSAQITAPAIAKHWAACGGDSGQAQRRDWDLEPEGWRAWWRSTYPPEDFPNAERYEDGEWSMVPDFYRREIFLGMKRQPLSVERGAA